MAMRSAVASFRRDGHRGDATTGQVSVAAPCSHGPGPDTQKSDKLEAVRAEVLRRLANGVRYPTIVADLNRQGSRGPLGADGIPLACESRCSRRRSERQEGQMGGNVGIIRGALTSVSRPSASGRAVAGCSPLSACRAVGPNLFELRGVAGNATSAALVGKSRQPRAERFGYRSLASLPLRLAE